MEEINFKAATGGKINGGTRREFTRQFARQITQKGGWYVARYGTGWAIGEMHMNAPLEHYPLVNDDREPIIFRTVEQALQFLREECSIYCVAVYHR